jgi:hypothetical protein
MAKLARAEVFDPSEVTIVRNQMGTHTLLTCRTALFEKGHSICSGCSVREGTQHLFGLFVRTHLGGKPVGWQWIAVANNTFCRQANVLNRCFHAENQLICAAPKNQLPELTWFAV